MQDKYTLWHFLLLVRMFCIWPFLYDDRQCTDLSKYNTSRYKDPWRKFYSIIKKTNTTFQTKSRRETDPQWYTDTSNNSVLNKPREDFSSDETKFRARSWGYAKKFCKIWRKRFRGFVSIRIFRSSLISYFTDYCNSWGDS